MAPQEGLVSSKIDFEKNTKMLMFSFDNLIQETKHNSVDAIYYNLSVKKWPVVLTAGSIFNWLFRINKISAFSSYLYI